MSAVSATTQDVVVGNEVSQQPTVLVHDTRDRPVRGVHVTFVDTALVSAFTATTNADGIATTPWFVSKYSGVERLTATVTGVASVVFVANVRPDAPFVISAASVIEQLGDPGQIVLAPPQVRVQDEYNNLTPGVTVTFVAAGPANTPTTTTTAVTDAIGLAKYGPWTLGTAFGEYTLTATFAGQTNPPIVLRARVNKPFPVSLVAAGGTSSCALAVDAQLYCWGAGVLPAPVPTPTLVLSAPPLVSLVMGDRHGCGLTSAGAAYCWGRNDVGQLGIGTLSSNEPQLRAVAGGLSFASLSAGSSFTCGLTTDQRAFCWGDNTVGELGNGGTTTSLTPSAVSTAERFTTLAAGYGHVCAVATTGKLYCWGVNNTNQLGGPSTDLCTVPSYDYYGTSTTTQVPCSRTPFAVPNAPVNFTTLVASVGTCGLIVGAQTPYCWGFFGSTVLPAGQFLSLAAAGNSICGITAGQTIICWSYDDPYGYGTTIPPTIIFGVTGPSTIVAGFDHWCAISGTAGPVYCWGENQEGQLGTGLHIPSTTAVLVGAP